MKLLPVSIRKNRKMTAAVKRGKPDICPEKSESFRNFSVSVPETKNFRGPAY